MDSKPEDDYQYDYSYVMNLLAVMLNIFDHKPYAITKQMKIDFITYLLTHYSISNDAKFKRDLINVLIMVYNKKEFRDMISDRKVISYLRSETEIDRIDDLIHLELEKSSEEDFHDRAGGEEHSTQVEPTPVKEWQEFFPSYTQNHSNYVIQTRIRDDIDQADDLNPENFDMQVPSTSTPTETKFKILELFFEQLSRKFNANLSLRKSTEAAKQHLVELKTLVEMEQSTLNVKWVERFEELNKTNKDYRDTIQGLDDMVKGLLQKNKELERLGKWRA